MTSASRLTVIAICIAATAGALRLSAATDLAPAARLSTLPWTIGAWRGRDDGRLDADTERTLKADAYTLRTYTAGANQVGLYIAYYATQRSGHTIHSPLNCLPGNGWSWLDRARTNVATASGPIEINRAIVQKDADRLLVYYWYQSRGRVVANDFSNKLLLAYDAFRLHRSDGALVRVIAPFPGGRDPSVAASAFVRELYPHLTGALPE